MGAEVEFFMERAGDFRLGGFEFRLGRRAGGRGERNATNQFVGGKRIVGYGNIPIPDGGDWIPDEANGGDRGDVGLSSVSTSQVVDNLQMGSLVGPAPAAAPQGAESIASRDVYPRPESNPRPPIASGSRGSHID